MRDNMVSKSLFIIGIALMVIGLLTGVIIAAYGFQYGLDWASSMMWSVLFSYFFAGCVLGLLFIGLSEIVHLLHSLNHKLRFLEGRTDKGIHNTTRAEMLDSNAYNSEEEKAESNIHPDDVQGKQKHTHIDEKSKDGSDQQMVENGISADSAEDNLDAGTKGWEDNRDETKTTASSDQLPEKEWMLTQADKDRVMDYFHDEEVLEIIPSYLEGYSIVKMMGEDGYAFVRIVDVRGPSIQEIHDPELKQPIIAWYNRS